MLSSIDRCFILNLPTFSLLFKIAWAWRCTKSGKLGRIQIESYFNIYHSTQNFTLNSNWTIKIGKMSKIVKCRILSLVKIMFFLAPRKVLNLNSDIKSAVLILCINVFWKYFWKYVLIASKFQSSEW